MVYTNTFIPFLYFLKSQCKDTCKTPNDDNNNNEENEDLVPVNNFPLMPFKSVSDSLTIMDYMMLFIPSPSNGSSYWIEKAILAELILRGFVTLGEYTPGSTSFLNPTQPDYFIERVSKESVTIGIPLLDEALTIMQRKFKKGDTCGKYLVLFFSYPNRSYLDAYSKAHKRAISFGLLHSRKSLKSRLLKGHYEADPVLKSKLVDLIRKFALDGESPSDSRDLAAIYLIAGCETWNYWRNNKKSSFFDKTELQNVQMSMFPKRFYHIA